MSLAYPDVVDESPDVLFVLFGDALKAFDICLFVSIVFAPFVERSDVVGIWRE